MPLYHIELNEHWPDVTLAAKKAERYGLVTIELTDAEAKIHTALRTAYMASCERLEAIGVAAYHASLKARMP